MNRPLAPHMSRHAKTVVWPGPPQGIKNGVSGQAGGRLLCGLGSAGRSMFALDLDAPSAGWTALAPFPGPARDGAACAVVGGRLFVVSGLGKTAPDDAAPRVLQDVFTYDPATDIWTRLETKPPAGFLGASAFALDDDRIGLVGGVNTSVFDSFMIATAAAHPEKRQRTLEAFMSMPPEDHKWNTKLWVYSISANAWSDLGDNPFLPNTGAACVTVPNGVLLINGEIKPGLRTPQVKHIGFQAGGVTWSEQDPIPPLDGRPLQDGLAGAYAGHAGGVLLVAGGANFHGSRAIAANGEWYAHRGLQKLWNREIYAQKDGKWRVAGQLPFGLAYGASFELPHGLLLVGGEDQDQIARNDVLLLTWDDLSGQVICTSLLPEPVHPQLSTNLQGTPK